MKDLTLFKKSNPAAAPAKTFRVPSLTEVDPEYAALVEKSSAFGVEAAALRDERKRLEREIKEDRTPYVRPGVAELLGDEPASKPFKEKRIAEIRLRLMNLDGAQEAIISRIDAARGRAVMAVRDFVKPEYAKRIGMLCEAMVALDAAHRQFAELADDAEARGVDAVHLGDVVPYFLGLARDPDRKIAMHLRKAQAAGYWSSEVAR